MAEPRIVASGPTAAAGTWTLAGRPVHRIGFGAMQLPGRRVFGPPRDRNAAIAVLRRAVDLGVNHIDTAQYYGPDVSNELIHSALYPYPDDLVLVSKVGAGRDDRGGWTPAQRPDQLRAGVEANLRSLGVEQLGAVNLRLLDAGEGDADAVEFDDQLAEMVALRDEGKIRGIGVSNVTAAQVRHGIEGVGIACVQNAFSVVQRNDDPIVELCRQHVVAFVPFFPLGSAFPGMRKVSSDPVVAGVAARLGVTAGQVGLAWLLAHAENILLIPGTSSLAHLDENVAAANVALDDQATRELDALASSAGPAR